MINVNTNTKATRSRYPTILNDGNTVAWYDSQLLKTITKDGSDFVSAWNDKLGSGHDLLQAVGANQPKWVSINGILFDGISCFMKTAAFTLIQPEMIYMVFKQVTWTTNEIIFDGNTSNLMHLRQSSASPGLNIYAGIVLGINSDLTLNTFCIASVLFNAASSKLQIDQNTPLSGDAGAVNAGGFTIGSNGGGLTQHSNIQVKEIIIRKVADGATNEANIYSYLSKKYGI